MANTDFDPDAYLAAASPTPTEPAAFDPDKYLAAPAERTGPTAYDRLADVGKDAKIGFNTLAEDARELVGRIPYVGQPIVKAVDAGDRYLHPEMKDSGELIKRDTEAMRAAQTPETQAAAAKKWWDQDKGTFGEAWTDWRSYTSGLVQSLPEQVITMVPAARLAKWAYEAKIAAGAAPVVAAKAASRVAMVAGGLAEGALGGAQSSREVRDEVNKLPDNVLNQSEAYRSLLLSGMAPAEAKAALADDLATRAFVTASVVTGMFGGMGDRALVKIFTEGASKAGLRKTLGNFGKGALAEGVFEELPQSVGQQVAQNEAVQHANPNKSLMDDVINQGLGGMTLGALQGAGMGAISGAAGQHHAEPAADAAPPEDQANQLRSMLGEPPINPAAPPPAAPATADQRSILGEEPAEAERPDAESYVSQAMQNLKATSRTANGVLDTSSTPGKEDSMTGVSAKHAATLAKENYESVVRGLYDRLDAIPQDGQSMAGFIDSTAEWVNDGIVKPGEIMRTKNTKIPGQTEAKDLPAAHAQFSEEMAARLADPNADPVETAAWIEWRSNLLDHFWTDGVGKTSKALAAIPLMRAGLPLPNYPSSREFYSYSPKERVDPSGDGEAYLGPAWDRFNAFYHSLVEKPEPQQRADLKAMLGDPSVPLNAITDHPLVKRAAETNRQALVTGSPEDFADPKWRAQRVYDFGGEPVHGWDEAVDRLVDQAKAFSTAEPVENGYHAVIVLGPPAAGKSTVSEPLARSLRAALVDADEAKKVIPEYRNGLGTSAVHEESSKLAGGVLERLVATGSNIIMPKVGHGYETIKGIVDRLKKLGYTVDIAHVSATPAISQRRNIARFLETGRLVDPEYITNVGDKPRDTAYMLKGDANDFVDASTSNGFEILEGSGPLADALRARRNVGWSPDRGTGPGNQGQGRAGSQGTPELIGEPIPGMQAHRVTDADGRSVEVAPVVVEAGSLRTSRDYDYDQDLQPRDRDRAASDAQIREITNKLDPERLGYSSEADRGSPIVGSDGMVESGNGRVIALRNVYDKNAPQAQAYRDWLSRQGVNVAAYQNPILVRQRLTPMTPKERQAFTLAANRPATLAMSAPERAVSDARHIDARMLDLIKNPEDIGSLANRAFFRRFLSMLPKSEHGVLADAKGHLSAEGLTRARNAILAKAYGDTGVLARIAESTNDDVKSISNALTAAAPAWAKLRAAVEAGAVRPEMDTTAELVQAVARTAEIRSRGEKLDTFLDQQDAFDRLPAEVEGFMRLFYDPKGRRAASAQRITDALRFYAGEAEKVSTEKGLGLDLVPVDASAILRLAQERERNDAEKHGVQESNRGPADGADNAARGREARGSWLGEGREVAAQRRDAGDQVDEEIRAQRPTFDELRGRVTDKTKAGDQFVFPGGERISTAELARRRAAEPLRPRREQKAADFGLFGEVAPQVDLANTAANFDVAPALRLKSEEEARLKGGQYSAIARRKSPHSVERGYGDTPLSAQNDSLRRLGTTYRLTEPVLQNREQTPTIEGTTESGDGRQGPGIQPAAPGIPGKTQARRLAKTPAKRPPELPLFGWGGSERPVSDIDGAIRPESGDQGSAVPGTGPSVTKPPARSGRARAGRTDSPAVKGRLEAERKIAERSRSNYRITPEDQIGAGNARQKINGNLAAIRTLRLIEDENRFATPAEKAVLVKYVGWGAFAQDMFAAHKPEWKNERDAFRAMVSDDEFNAAKASTLNAHFTSPEVVRGMWDAMEHLGFKGGQAIEPAAGVGHFIGMTPDKVAAKTAWTAVELDPLTGGIAKALYGGSDVGIHGFEDLKRPSNYYDLAISNVPFGDYQISEKPYGSFPIHDFFFVKSLDKVRPGGIVSFITSRYTMDRVAPETRRLLGQTADLVGAIRLPGGRKGAFAGNAGTEVTTDIIFLRKKVPGEPAFPGAAWSELKEIQTPEGPASINEYFADRPEMMLGEMRLQGTMYRANEPVLVGDAEGLQQRIAEAARKMPEGALLPMKSQPAPAINGDEIGAGIKDGSFFVQNGKLYQRRQGQGHEHPLAGDEFDRVTRLIDMRGTINDLLKTQLEAGENGKERSDALREALRGAYDAFVAKYGPINKEVRTVTSRLNKDGEPVVITKRPNLIAFSADPDSWKVAAIEGYDPETGKTKRNAIQTKDVIAAPSERQINGPSDALSASLNDTAGVDLDHIAQSLNLDSHDAVVHALGDLIYQNPDGRRWETADQYLSGDVVKKLEDARVLAQQDPTYLRNVAGLEKVQPAPLSGADITAQFGAPWIPETVYQDFLAEIGIQKPKVVRIPVTGEWRFDYQNATRDAQTKYGTDRVEVGKIVNSALNNKMVTVYDRTSDDKAVVNDKATQEARVKAELLKEAFTGDAEHGIDGWIFSEPERAQLLEGIYNRTYNNLAPRKFDGSHLTMPGMNPDFATRKHRLDAIWRVIQSGNTLLAHVVGSGKTATMIGAGMEEKRLGLVNKPAYVIPNHMLEQFSREFIETYPNAKILVAQKDEMTREHRKEFLAKVATNDWDGIIITHDAFGRVNMGHEFRTKFIQDQIDELERVMQTEAVENGKGSMTVKNLEKAKKKLKERLQNLMNEDRKDAGTSFEESGIDRLYVDEAHKFKNLQFITRLSNISGLAQGNSQRAEDLFLKIRYLEQKRPGRSAVFATGTPVSNTMAELWTMMRYLELDKLRERGLDTFDAWASTFGRVVSNMELSPDGRTFKEKSSFSKFVNIPELVALYSEVADTKTADMLNLPRPEVKTRSGAPGIEIVEASPSAQEEEHIDYLVKLAESLKGKRPEKGQPNMLSVVTAGRKVATDGRLIGANFDFNPQGKIAKAVDNITRIYQQGNADPTAPNKVQMVFLDMGVPQTRSAKKAKPIDGEISAGPTEADRINLYADLKQRLIEKGIPAREIAAIHDASDDDKKAKLFKRVRSGDVRVIMGSSEKMGVGTNVQDQLIAMHHLDAPWKPADVEQRDGRIVRQGNKNKTVQIYRYVTKKSFDAFMWQKLDTKSKFIGQVLSGAKGSRHAEDIDNPLPEAAEMKAAASGDPRILELAEMDRVVRALTAQRRTYESTKARAASEIGQAKSRIEQYEDALPNAKADAAAVQDISGDRFAVELDGNQVTNRDDAGKEILARLVGIEARSFYAPKIFTIGKMAGLTMNMEVRGAWDGTQAIVRATPSLKGKSSYSAANDTVINEHTAPAGLIRRFENIIANIKSNPERLERQLTLEKESLGKLQKTESGVWPRDKEYREALKKLDDLSKAMKAPQSPDVTEIKAQRPDIVGADETSLRSGSRYLTTISYPHRDFEVLVNPSYNETQRFMREHDEGVRVLRDSVGNLFMWDGHSIIHVDAARAIYGDSGFIPRVSDTDFWVKDDDGKVAATYADGDKVNAVREWIDSGRNNATKEFLTYQDKPAWAVLVDPIDNTILHSVHYKHAANNGFDHSSYLPERFVRMVDAGDAILAWGDSEGIHAMEPLSPQMRAAIAKHYDPAVKSRTGWEAADGRDFGPQPGERAIRLGTGTYAHVSSKYTAAEQQIADAVKAIGERMAPQADVVGTKALRMFGNPIWGAFVNNATFPHLIAWSLEKGGASQIAGTVRHEIIHHLRAAGLIRPKEWAALQDAAVKGNWLGKHQINSRYPNLSLDHKIEESVAEQFSQWRSERSIEKPGLIRDAFQRMDLMLRRIAAAARQFLGREATANDVFTRIETGEVGHRGFQELTREQEALVFGEAARGQSARQTDTPAFKKWFGESKVVDAEGKPLVAYHGTVHDFSEFDTRRESKKERPSRAWSGDLGSWFAAPSKHQSNYDEGNAEDQAGSYAEDPNNGFDFADGANIKPAYLSIQTPKEYEDWEEFYDDRHEDGKRLSAEKFRSKLEAKGHDGIVIRNSETDGDVDRDDWIAFHPTQIKSATGNRGTFDPADPDIRAQTPGREARERRQAAGAQANTIMERVVQSSDALRARADAYADRIGVNEVLRGLQMKAVPMAARDATVESRTIAKEYANARRQSRHDWNSVDKFLMDNFPADRRKAMWEAADEQSVAMQQNLPTAGLGLDRLPPNERAVVQMLQTRGNRNFADAQSLKMVQAVGLPSYAPRMLVRMTADKAEVGAGAGSEIVKDIRTLALANARLEDAIAARKLINAIEDVGRRTGSQTVNGGGAPMNKVGADGVAIHALDQMGKGFATTTPQLRHRKHLTAADTEAAANLVRTPDPDAPKWFTLNNPAFMRMEPRLRVNATTGKVELIKDTDGNPILDRKPIYVRSDFEGPLRAVLSKDSDKFYQALMALKGKAMSVIMMSPLIHNQVEWGRALPAAPGKVLTFQTYIEGNKVAHDPALMRQAIAGGTSPIGGHGFMQDLVSIAEAPTVRPGRSLTAKGLGYAAEATGHITRLFNPRAGADEVRRAVDYMGNVWHNTLLWDRIRDLQMGLWSHINEGLVQKGYSPYAANVAASHFANRYAGALPIEAMSGGARAIANIMLFSRSFTLGNLGAFKDAAIGLPRDAQAMIEHHAGWDELQKIQSFVRRKSLSMLAIDAGMYYVTLSALQSAFATAGVVPSVATLGGMIAGGALGGKAGKYGRLAATVGGGAAAFVLAGALGASPGTKKLEDELEGYWDRFVKLMQRLGEHPFETAVHPIDALESLSSTSDNEPGKKGRILVGYEPDGSAIYARLAVGKVTEELLGWTSSPNEMLHNKLSTFARPLNQIWSNDVGFGHKLYNPKADTFGEQAKNLFKIVANIVGSQVPTDTIKGAYEWAEGGPGSDVAGLKALAPFIGTTISKGYPGGPELGVLNDARERAKFDQNEWTPSIRKMIRNGEIEKAVSKMAELGMSPGVQKYFITTTQNPKARLSKRQMQDFMRYATPEQRKDFDAAQQRSTETRAAGGPVGRADESYGDWRERIGWASGGRVSARADGGPVQDDPDYDMEGAVAAGAKADERGHWPDTYKRPSHITFSDESVYHGPDNPGGHWDRVQGDEWNFTPGQANLQRHSVPELQDYFAKHEPESHLILPPQRAHGGRVDASNINPFPTEAQKHAGNYAKDHVNIFGLPLTIENAKGSIRRGVGPDGKAWACALPAHYGYVKRTHGQDDDHIDVYLGPHTKSPHVFVIDQHDHRSGLMDEHKAMLGFGSQKQALACYERGFSDGKGRARIGAVTTMTFPQFKEWLATETEKRTHASVDYVEQSAGKDHCAICAHFIPGNPPACKGVKSPISAAGWCKRFKPT